MSEPDIQRAAESGASGVSLATGLTSPEPVDDFASADNSITAASQSDHDDFDTAFDATLHPGEFDVNLTADAETPDIKAPDAEDVAVEATDAEESGAEASDAEESDAEQSDPDQSRTEAPDAAPADSRAPLALSADADAAAEQARMVEALLFAAAEPLDEETLGARLPAGADIPALLGQLQARMQGRGVELVQVAGGWRLQTPADLAWLLEEVREERRKLSAAARETLAIIAYHQPVTRAEIEEIRGVAVSKGTVDMLMELGWVRMRGRRRTPGRPVTYGTTDLFLSHFGLESLTDLPGKAELKAAGMLDSRLPPDFAVPEPGVLRIDDEDPLDDAQAAGVEQSDFHVDFMEDEGQGGEVPAPQARSA